ncbi:TrgA family protein [Aliiroseovarius sp. KMU-50]|uniref:TrgA family protein n=1 Tax=Aliiroseovarius salicola TaxID=3009082 RepID=A0ABT4W4E4_9RHOB|nr:TrgA family protein [Aliiroseovarius sp. KMU-50]MDA5094682.1 TrgA family protein [Aliiroseovarius sp. KMU-50]
MPTAAKLVAGVFFAALAYLLADMIKPYLPDGRSYAAFSPAFAALGLLVGWRFTGQRLGRGLGTVVGIGLSSGFLLCLWGLILFSGYEMVRMSMRKAYDGPVEAMKGMIGIAVDYVLLIAPQPDVMVALVLGSLFGGWLTRITSSRWS